MVEPPIIYFRNGENIRYSITFIMWERDNDVLTLGLNTYFRTW